MLILGLGANDGLRGVDAPTVERNLATMIERAQSRGVHVLPCGMETPPLRGWNYTSAFHDMYPCLALRYNVALVPFLLQGVVLRGDLNYDGIHPNAAGAKILAENMWPYLERVLAGLKNRPATAGTSLDSSSPLD